MAASQSLRLKPLYRPGMGSTGPNSFLASQISPQPMLRVVSLHAARAKSRDDESGAQGDEPQVWCGSWAA